MCFLRLVSQALIASQDMLTLLEEHELKRYKQRLESGEDLPPLQAGTDDGQDDEEPITAVVVSPQQ
jgi:hypothetical protein